MTRGLFDLTCGQCGRMMEETKTGYLTCPIGHGKLQIAPGICSASREPDMFAAVAEVAAASDCEWCGRDLPAEVAAIGGRYCGQCGDVLNRNALAISRSYLSPLDGGPS